MKLVKEDIKNIDTYLRHNGIKYMDVRYELIDHLATEYEGMDNYPDLRSFLNKRLGWCKKVAEKKATSIHWIYQRGLWKRLLRFFTKPVFHLLVFITLLGLLELTTKLDFKHIYKYLIITLSIPYIVYIYYMIKFEYFTNKDKQLVSMVYLNNIYSLPIVFISLFGVLKDFLTDNWYIFLVYWFFTLLLSIAAALEIGSRQKQVLKEYKFLKTYLV